jgi:hypothetical protein
VIHQDSPGIMSSGYPSSPVDFHVHLLTGKFDVLHISGAERFNQTKGDGLHLEFQGNFTESCPKDSDGISIASRLVWLLSGKQDSASATWARVRAHHSRGVCSCVSAVRVPMCIS